MVRKWNAVTKYASSGRGICQWFSTCGSQYQKDKETVVSVIIGYRLQHLLAEALKGGLLAIKLTLKKSPHSKTIFNNRIFLHESIDYQLRCALMTC